MIQTFVSTVVSSILILLAITPTNAALDEELVFYLTFDNITDQTVVDKSGNGLGAKVHKNTEIVKGKYGDAIHFTTPGLNCVNIPSQEKVKVTGEITMMAWVYHHETWKGKKVHWLDKACHSIEWETSYGMMNADIGNGPQMWMFLGSRNNQGNTDRQEFTILHEMAEKKWHHVAGSYDGKTMKIYLDGKIIGEEKKEFNFVGDNNADVRIGCSKNKPQYSFVNGSIDEAAVWQRALTNEEIKQAMGGDFLAVSPSDRAATTWADVKRRMIAPY